MSLRVGYTTIPLNQRGPIRPKEDIVSFITPIKREFVPYLGNHEIMAVPVTPDTLGPLNEVLRNRREVEESVAKRNELDRLASGKVVKIPHGMEW